MPNSNDEMTVDDLLEFMKGSTVFKAIGITILTIILFWFVCLNHISVNEVGIAYNSTNGKWWVQNTPGWYLTSPFVSECTISTLPRQLSITSNSKVLNVKLVQFNPDGIDEYIHLQGFGYGMGTDLDLIGYAFSGKKYSFLDVIQEATPEKTPDEK